MSHPLALSENATGSEKQPIHQKSKRLICHGCNFPPRTCVCSSLPPEPLHPLFKHCRIIVLQHPHELRRKNRSLPLVDLCVLGKNEKERKSDEKTKENLRQSNSEITDTLAQEGDFVMKTIIGRRFGDQCDSAAMKILRDPNEVIVLVFPHKQAMDLEEGIRLAEKRCRLSSGTNHNKGIENTSQSDESKVGSRLSGAMDSEDKDPNGVKRKKMTLIFIDATWKHACEMETKTDNEGEWPEHLIRVQMTPSDLNGKANGGGNTEEIGKAENDSGNEAGSDPKSKTNNNDDSTFIERRFQIRTPPSPDHLSTAECLAWIASRVEHNPQIYQSIMKTLDFMVEVWKGFTKSADNHNKSGSVKSGGGGRVRGFTDGDGCIAAGWDSMSQKKRKIK